MYTVELNNQKIIFEEKITLEELAKKFQIPAYLAKVNNRLRELGYYINYDCQVEFLDLDSYEAMRAYETSLRYLIIMALERLIPGIKVKFHYCVSRSVSCELIGKKFKIDQSFINQLRTKMEEIIAAEFPIIRKKIDKEKALQLYHEKGYDDKVEVLAYRPEDEVNLYECDGYTNYMFGYMVSNTRCLDNFKLLLYHPYFLLQYPRAEEEGRIPPFEDSPRFGKMLTEARMWAKTCDSDTIAKMNQHHHNNTLIDLVNMCETKHNNMLAELGLKIKDDIENIRLIAIAGPSSSGKTTFSHRLRVELMTRGIQPVKISIDDYYLNREDAPKDEEGNPDLEHIEALDVELFNQQLLALIQGEEVELPVFDFQLGHRIKGHRVKVKPNQPIIIEGIHALNERLTSLIPKHQKFKIYISPLSQINIDNHTPINPTDLRLLRRVVRDAKYRKTSPENTFSMWNSVRRGEFKWIYPFQEQSDYVFNSELTYELGVMKKYALPALESIDRNSEYFIPANRLIKFLKYFKDIDDRLVPCNSLLREFIGDSCFYE
ncbi:MAG: nucleoside kinase [Bacilli bacterium]|jgi:uridine kinase|nr:nucleoside kinase [Bacilli bacterium]MDY0063458.1 nucleoside kinase [Bacilli bacterium]